MVRTGSYRFVKTESTANHIRSPTAGGRWRPTEPTCAGRVRLVFGCLASAIGRYYNQGSRFTVDFPGKLLSGGPGRGVAFAGAPRVHIGGVWL